jgi:transposase-like protein
MRQYSDEFKDSIIAKMLPPNNTNVPELAHETGIPKDTLYCWRAKARKGEVATPQATSTGELSGEEKFAVVVETASLNELELGTYCRRKGLYPEQIGAWKAACMQANTVGSSQAERAQRRADKQQIKQLERELRRKEKALAEAAALLVLKKKVRTLLAEPEEGRSMWRNDER